MQNRASCQRGRHIPRRHAIRSFRYAFAGARDREASEEKRKKKKGPGGRLGGDARSGRKYFYPRCTTRERERKEGGDERKRRKERCARYTHTHARTTVRNRHCHVALRALARAKKKKKKRARNSRERKTRFKLAIRDKHWSTSLRFGRWRYLLTFRDQNGWADNCVDVEKTRKFRVLLKLRGYCGSNWKNINKKLERLLYNVKRCSKCIMFKRLERILSRLEGTFSLVNK